MAKVFECLVNDQLKQFLFDNNILSESQSGFRSCHSTITAAMLVTNDIIKSLDSKQHYVVLFVDLSKAFDSVGHELLLQKLSCIGLREMALNWFKNYLSERTQCLSRKLYLSPTYSQQRCPAGIYFGPHLIFYFYK